VTFLEAMLAIRQVPLWLVLALILGIAAFLRLAGLAYESLWIDEVLTYRVSQAPLLKIPQHCGDQALHELHSNKPADLANPCTFRVEASVSRVSRNRLYQLLIRIQRPGIECLA